MKKIKSRLDSGMFVTIQVLIFYNFPSCFVLVWILILREEQGPLKCDKLLIIAKEASQNRFYSIGLIIWNFNPIFFKYCK
jgi:hypothetical protein